MKRWRFHLQDVTAAISNPVSGFAEWNGAEITVMLRKVASDFDAQPQPASWQDKDLDFAGSWSAQYNQKICWFLHYFYDLFWEGMSYEQFVEKYKIIYQDSEGYGFKMNMLPVRFANRASTSIQWDDKLAQATGFNSFDEYREWYVEHRGKFFRKLLEKIIPKSWCVQELRKNKISFAFLLAKPYLIRLNAIVFLYLMPDMEKR